MAFQWKERQDSRRTTRTPPTYVSRWTATGEANEMTVEGHALGATPYIIVRPSGFLYRQTVDIESVGADHYIVTVPYAARKRETGSLSIDFDTTGGTVHISNSKETIQSYGTSPFPFGKLIGVHGETVEGTDIVSPNLRINCTFSHPTGFLTIPQIKYLASITGMVCSTPFLTFAAGEVLFLGASGREGTDAPTEVRYSFAASSNATGLSVGAISSIAKKGWEYLWITYQDTVVSGDPGKTAKWVYVERVYDTVDLVAALGFG